MFHIVDLQQLNPKGHAACYEADDALLGLIDPPPLWQNCVRLQPLTERLPFGAMVSQNQVTKLWSVQYGSIDPDHISGGGAVWAVRSHCRTVNVGDMIADFTGFLAKRMPPFILGGRSWSGLSQDIFTPPINSTLTFKDLRISLELISLGGIL